MVQRKLSNGGRVAVKNPPPEHSTPPDYFPNSNLGFGSDLPAPFRENFPKYALFLKLPSDGIMSTYFSIIDQYLPAQW